MSAVLCARHANAARVHNSNLTTPDGHLAVEEVQSVFLEGDTTAETFANVSSNARKCRSDTWLFGPTSPLKKPSWREWESDLLNLELGFPGQALIPKLVPLPGFTYELKNKEDNDKFKDQVKNNEKNEYKWELDEIRFPSQRYECELDLKIAKLKGKLTSDSFGHKSVHVYDTMGREIFKIRHDKNVWNPLALRWSFRILPPGSKDSSDALFTFNKDVFGRGLIGLQEEWRIYRGRERDNDMVLYCVGDYKKHNFVFYRRAEDYDNSAQPVATIKQKKDKIKLMVPAGEDTALMLAMSTILDMTHLDIFKKD
jgi:hypothetical protein